MNVLAPLQEILYQNSLLQTVQINVLLHCLASPLSLDTYFFACPFKRLMTAPVKMFFSINLLIDIL